MPHVRSTECLDTRRSGLWVIDLQEKLLPVIPSADSVLQHTIRLLQAAAELDVPTAATVQYPKGLGSLDESIAKFLPEPEEKLEFSAAVCRGALDEWTESGRDQIVIAGIETHICVMQTVLDLLAEGLRVFVVAEAVAARHGHDHEIAMDRMRDSGAMMTTSESVLYEWLRTADHPKFKSISTLVKSFKPNKPNRPLPKN